MHSRDSRVRVDSRASDGQGSVGRGVDLVVGMEQEECVESLDEDGVGLVVLKVAAKEGVSMKVKDFKERLGLTVSLKWSIW